MLVEDDLNTINSLKNYIGTFYKNIDLTDVYYLDPKTNIEKIVQDIQTKNIELLFVDGLDGDWKNILDKLKENNVNARFVLVSGNLSYVEEARKLGIPSYDKDYYSVLKKEIGEP